MINALSNANALFNDCLLSIVYCYTLREPDVECVNNRHALCKPKPKYYFFFYLLISLVLTHCIHSFHCNKFYNYYNTIIPSQPKIVLRQHIMEKVN